MDAAFRDVLNAYVKSNHRRNVEIIEKAYRFAKEAHKGARRQSGEPYILHPIAVAKIVISEMGLGSTSICTALLHDVVEESEYTREDIAAAFGETIASLVEGLTKISGGIFDAESSVQAEKFRKLLLSMSTDVRVVLIKMADRLHNMRTLQYVRPEKQRKITRETLYIYAPLAHRLGLYKIKTELQDLAFRYEHPRTYAEIMERVSETEGEREAMVEEFIAPIRRKLDAAGYKYEILTRVKSAYSIWNKMEKKKISFDEVYDLYAVRVVFENDDDNLEKLRCFEIYTFFTDDNRLHPDRTRDWVSAPKSNGYRALHLTAMGPRGKWIEVQIRSRKMDEIAELGYAAHWKYKEGVSGDDTELDKWMGKIKDILAHPDPNSLDFLDTVKLNLFSAEIYVFTPKGDLKKLPKGATVLDLAFDIHTQLGMHCLAGKVNHKLVPMSHVLESGDQVEIITSQSQHPQPEWLDYAITARAKEAVRTHIRKNRKRLAERGEKLFVEFLQREGLRPGKTLLKRILAHYGLKQMSELYEMLASEEINLTPDEFKEAESARTSLWRRLIPKPFSGRRKEGERSEMPEPSVTKITAEIDIEGFDRPGMLEEIARILGAQTGVDLRGLNITANNEVFNCHITVAVETEDISSEICRLLTKTKGVKSAKHSLTDS